MRMTRKETFLLFVFAGALERDLANDTHTAQTVAVMAGQIPEEHIPDNIANAAKAYLAVCQGRSGSMFKWMQPPTPPTPQPPPSPVDPDPTDIIDITWLIHQAKVAAVSMSTAQQRYRVNCVRAAMLYRSGKTFREIQAELAERSLYRVRLMVGRGQRLIKQGQLPNCLVLPTIIPLPSVIPLHRAA
jgi:hypothetical protein